MMKLGSQTFLALAILLLTPLAASAQVLPPFSTWQNERTSTLNVGFVNGNQFDGWFINRAAGSEHSVSGDRHHSSERGHYLCRQFHKLPDCYDLERPSDRFTDADQVGLDLQRCPAIDGQRLVQENVEFATLKASASQARSLGC